MALGTLASSRWLPERGGRRHRAFSTSQVPSWGRLHPPGVRPCHRRRHPVPVLPRGARLPFVVSVCEVPETRTLWSQTVTQRPPCAAVCGVLAQQTALLPSFVTFYFELILDLQKSCKAGLRRGFDRPGRGQGGQRASWPREWRQPGRGLRRSARSFWVTENDRCRAHPGVLGAAVCGHGGRGRLGLASAPLRPGFPQPGKAGMKTAERSG